MNKKQAVTTPEKTPALHQQEDAAPKVIALRHVQITTYVLFSGKIKYPKTEITCGINTYRIRPIIMQDKNVLEVFDDLQKKLNAGVPLTRTDLLPLVLCPLMGGDMAQKERIKTAYTITRKATYMDAEDLQKIEAVLYIMADKFLDSIEMEQLKKEIKMTRLGQMLYNDGLEDGIAQGIQAFVELCKEMNFEKSITLDKLLTKYHLSQKDAEEKVDLYWGD